MRFRNLLLAGSALLTTTLSATARATPRPLPFTYIYETLAEGETEIEQYADVSPTRALDAEDGHKVWFGSMQFQTEIEHGITDHLELGLYLTYVPTVPDGLTSTASLNEGNGLKQRLRYRFADAGKWPVDVAVYGEVVENQEEVELEAKVILQRRVGPLRIAANAVVERGYHFTGENDWALAPSAGVVWEVSPSFQPGIEGWMRKEIEPAGVPETWDGGAHEYVGPTVLASFGRVWWSNGVYFRADNANHTMAPGESFGAVWARSIIGIGL